MKKVVILGAGGGIARLVTAMLAKKKEISLTLFVHNGSKFKGHTMPNAQVIEGDVLNYPQLEEVIKGQDIVYANLAGDLEQMAENIVKAMKAAGVKRLIFICSIGIYNVPLRPVLKPYRKAADIIEASGLDYTIIRPTWFTETDEIDYELTQKGKPELGSEISRKSLAAFITELIETPTKHIHENLGIDKPGS